MLIAPLLLILRFSFNQYDADRADDRDGHAGELPEFLLRPVLCRRAAGHAGGRRGDNGDLPVLGLPLAYRLARMQSRWKTAAMLAIVLPLFIGSTVRMVGWMILFAHGGLVDDWPGR